MKTNLLVLLFTVQFIASTKAQNFQWAFQAGSNSTDGGTAIVSDNNNNIIVTGFYTGAMNFGTYFFNGFSGSFISKFDSAGTLKWARNISFGHECYVSCDKAGNIYATGGCSKTDFNGGAGTLSVNPKNRSAFIAKYDPSGNVLWVKLREDSLYTSQGNAIKTDNDGNSYIVGSATKPYNYGYFIAKYDTQGNLLWTESHNDLTLSYVYPTSIDIDLSGNCYFSGYFNTTAYFNGAALTSSPSKHTIFITKYDKDGNLVWAKTEGSNYDEPNSIKVGKDGNFFLTGTFISPSTFGATTLDASNGNKNSMFIAKYDALGNNLWAKTPTQGMTSGKDVTIDAEGNCLVLGGMLAVADFGQGATSVTRDIFVSKYDKNGNCLWVAQPQGDLKNHAAAICSTNNNACYITGGFSESSIFGNTTLSAPYSTSGFFDFFIAKLKNASYVTNVNEVKKKNEIVVYPNPASNVINICFLSDDQINTAELIIKNALGQIVFDEKLVVNKKELYQTIDFSSYSKGMYFVNINSNGVIEGKKIIVE